MPATITKGNPGNRYPVKVMEFARRLAAANKRPFEIENALHRLGYSPSSATVKRWIDPEYAEWDTRRHRRPFKAKRARCYPERVALERMQVLRGIGLSFTAVAVVMNHDFDLKMTADQVRRIFGGSLSEASIRDLLGGKTIRQGGGRRG